MSAQTNSKATLWTGRILSGLAIIFLLFDAIMKFFMDKLPPEALEAGAALQWPIERMPLVGTILLICTVIHIIPRTAVLVWLGLFLRDPRVKAMLAK